MKFSYKITLESIISSIVCYWLPNGVVSGLLIAIVPSPCSVMAKYNIIRSLNTSNILTGILIISGM